MYGLHSIRYRAAKHWDSVQNSLKLNFANNSVPSKKFVKHSRTALTQIIQLLFDILKGIQLSLYYYIMPFSIY